MKTTLKYVVVQTVLDTEDFKQNQRVDKRACDGPRLINIKKVFLPNILILVWNRIFAETQMMIQEFGVTHQLKQVVSIVTQSMIKLMMLVSKNAERLLSISITITKYLVLLT